VKRKASTTGGIQLRRSRNVANITDDEDSNGNPNDSQGEADGYAEPTEKATSDEEDHSGSLEDIQVEASYVSTKALGDADREVSGLLSLQQY
jgi:hypothetical protein